MKNGTELMNEGIELSLNNADKATVGWKDDAMIHLLCYPIQEFMAEDIRNFAYKHGLAKPPNERAWGGIIKKARKEGYISHVGYRSVKNAKAHKTPASVWKLEV